MPESVFAVIFNDPQKRGYEKVASDVSRILEDLGFDPLFQSNEYPATPEQVEGPDFHVNVFASNERLMSLSAFDETRSPRQSAPEELIELVKLATKVLARVREKAEEVYSIRTPAESDLAYDPAEELEDALDAWDSFTRTVEAGGRYPGVIWPTSSDGMTPPEGWSWVERDDELDFFEDDEAAARVLVEKYGVPATEVRWFNRYDLTPHDGGDDHTGFSVAINIPEADAIKLTERSNA